MSHKATNWLASLPADVLTNSEFRVLFHLCDCHNPSQGCFPTQAYLIANTGVSNGTVNNALNGLEAKCLIKRHQSVHDQTKRQRPTRYILGFEMQEAQEPSPKTGDGIEGEPSPKTGDGAVSKKRAKPSPAHWRGTCKGTSKEPRDASRQGAILGKSDQRWTLRFSLEHLGRVGKRDAGPGVGQQGTAERAWHRILRAGLAEKRAEPMTDEAHETASGAGAVQTVLIDPLIADGLKRHPRVTAEAHEVFLKKLKETLRYMTPENLAYLRAQVSAIAEGKHRNIWPGLASIRNFAWQLQKPPIDEDEVVKTWLHSRAGPDIRAQGYLVEMVAYLRKFRRRPASGGYADKQLREEAAENARRIVLIEERIARGGAPDSDRAWLDWYRAEAERYGAIVDAGIAHRAARVEGAA